jgi:hypothetical protein
MDNNLLPLTYLQLNKSVLSPFVSEITPKDKKLLIKTVQIFRPNSIRYEDSWGYIIQATRNCGFKWYDPKTDSLIFFGKKSTTDETLVVPNFFADPDYLTKVINEIQKSLHVSKTILKNINPDELSQFTPYGFREYTKKERWDDEFKYDDQTYPQVILDLKRLVPAKGRNYHPLRKALNKNPNVTMRKYKTIDKKAVLEIFALNDENNIDSIEKLKGMYYASHVMYPTANIDKYVFIDNKTNQINGFTAMSDISPKSTSLVASIFRPESMNIGVWAMYLTLVKKYLEGFQIASLGGSETENTFKFKLEKFNPVQLLYKTHLIYNP